MKTYSRKVRDAEGGTHKSVNPGLLPLDTSNISRNILTSGLTSFTTNGSGYSSTNGYAAVAENSLLGQKDSTTHSIFQTPFPVEGSDTGVFKLGTSDPCPYLLAMDSLLYLWQSLAYLPLSYCRSMEYISKMASVGRGMVLPLVA